MERIAIAAVVALALTGCEYSEPVQFDTTATASWFEGHTASQASEHFAAQMAAERSVGVILSDEYVRELLGFEAVIAPESKCWNTSPREDLVTLDFEPCPDITGTATVTELVRQEWLVSLDDDFAIDGVDIDGHFTIEPSYYDEIWYVRSSNSALEIGAEPIRVDGASDVELSQMLWFDLPNSTLYSWGLGWVSSANPSQALLMGGETYLEALDHDLPPGAHRWDLDTHRPCPSGVSAIDTIVHVEEIVLDLDSLEQIDDGEDSPDIAMQVEFDVRGSLLVGLDGFETVQLSTVEASDPTGEVTAEELTARIREECEPGGSLASLGGCQGWINAAAGLEGRTIEVPLPAALVGDIILEHAKATFDTDVCAL